MWISVSPTVMSRCCILARPPGIGRRRDLSQRGLKGERDVISKSVKGQGIWSSIRDVETIAMQTAEALSRL